MKKENMEFVKFVVFVLLAITSFTFIFLSGLMGNDAYLILFIIIFVMLFIAFSISAATIWISIYGKRNHHQLENNVPSKTELLDNYKKMLANGMITKEEYEEKKNKILNQKTSNESSFEEI